MNNAKSYLSRLRFDPKLKNSLVAKYLANPRLLILLTLAILGAGLTSYFSLPRRLNPEINIPIVVISTVLPGAGPTDIEELVTIPIEDAVSGVEDVKTVTSSSRDSVSAITMEFESGVDPDKARTDVQSAIDTVSLPEDAVTPRVIKLDFENQPVWTFNLVTKGDVASLMRFSKTLKDELQELQTVETVSTSGLDAQEIQILLKPEAVSTYGINPLQLSQLITASVNAFPAGAIKTDTSSFALTIDPAIVTIDDIRALRLTISGVTLPLSDIATVQERSKPSQASSLFATNILRSRETVTFNVFKTGSANIDRAVEDAQKKSEEVLAPFGDQFTIQTVLNTGDEIADQFNELVRDFWIITILIIVTLFIFLGARQAFVAALSVPLTFFISFTVMNITGISLNFLSMFSLLLALGLLVDDAIVVVSAMTAYHRTKKFTPFEAGLLVWRDFVVAIFTTTITTVWAFLPLLLSSGIIGEFIKSIPIVVSATLLASFFVAMAVILPFTVLLLKPQIPSRVVILFRILLIVVLFGILYSIIPKGPLLIFEVLAIIIFLFVTSTVRLALIRRAKGYYQQQTKKSAVVRNVPAYFDNGIIHFERISSRYSRLIHRILISQSGRRNAIFMVILFSLFSYLLLPLGFVKNEFFPKSEYDFVYATLELPAGTNSDVASQEAKVIIEDLRKLKGTEFVTADVGQTLNQESGGTNQGETNNILFTIKLLPENKRTISSIELASELRDQYASYQKGTFSVVEISGGPPAGADLQIKLFGTDLTTLDTYATKIEDFLEKRPGVTNVNKTIKSGTSKLVFTPDKDKVAQAQLSPDMVGYWLRLYASGFSPESVKLLGNGNDNVDISLRMGTDTQSVSGLGSLMIPGQTGATPLASLGTISLKPNPTLITREDGKRTLSVTAGVEPGHSVSTLNQELEAFANTQLQLPQGYSWQTGGVNEENQNSVNSILQAMMLSFLLIVITMVLQFGSFRKALIVMLVIPLSISGVFIIFALTQTPLSFPALIGVLALFGIVVKNAILIVDKIKQNIDIGMPFVDAIVDGSSSRLEAIALTSMTAIIGLIPVTLSDPLWRGLGGAIIAGLVFSGTIMLFFIPVVYYYWFAGSEGKSRRLR